MAGEFNVKGGIIANESIAISQSTDTGSIAPGKTLVSYQPVTWYYNSDSANLWEDSKIRLSWDASADLELTLKTLGASNKTIQVSYNRGSTDTVSSYDTENTYPYKFDLDSNFSTATTGVAKIFCIGDNTYPVYTITIVRASNANPGIWAQVEKMVYN